MMVRILVVHKLRQLYSFMRTMDAFAVWIPPILQILTVEQTVAKPLLPVLPFVKVNGDCPPLGGILHSML